MKVTSQIDLRVKVAFITVYSYQQTANDDWENGVLVRTRIQTNDDGKETLVQAEARDGQLAVQGPSGSSTTQLGAMTDISFWNQAITQGPALVDSQTAELIKIQVEGGDQGTDHGSRAGGRSTALLHDRDQRPVRQRVVR